MRPIRITISAFASYAGKTVLEMDKLGHKGLYLITGDTGAGKTTIFDAITFALFGEASGENRKASMLRSKYADAETPTFVELVFEYSGKIYRIIRWPEYERLSKRGDGKTLQKAEAELSFPDGRIVTKSSEVTNEIKDIMGIDRNQFTQIAMIAQGDFLKLLLAPTEDRTKIFRQIFKTELYQDLQVRLKAESGELGSKCDTLKSSIKQYINGVICKEDDVLNIELEKAKSGNLLIADTVALVEKVIEQDEEEQIKYDEELKKLDDQLKEINTLLGKAEELNKIKNGLDTAKKDLSINEPLLRDLFVAIELEQSLQPEREKLGGEITTAKNKLPQYDVLAEKKTALEGKIADQLKKSEAISQGKESLEVLLRELEKFKAELDTLKEAGTQKERLINQKDKAEIKRNDIRKLSDEITDYDTLLSSSEVALNNYESVA
ncbi:MAG: SMC family ATPase, partial [Candidatus Subteraquimicrobiales bacterium]|nr:SMC family ATPase [Candidatus Subteraquimicrobiales bacterium]